MDQCLKLFDFINKTINEQKPDYVCFLGDQFDNHGVVHLQVVAAFIAFIKQLRCPSIVLVGNHDRSNDFNQIFHGMEFLSGIENCTVVHSHIVKDDVLFVSYKHNPQKLIDLANEFNTKTLVCHASFNGGKYDNGFYIKDGIELTQVPQKIIISGHIHAAQVFGKITYVGSSRWININDVNAEKRFLLVDHDEDMYESIPIIGVPSIKVYQITNEEELKIGLSQDFLNNNICFDVVGNTVFIDLVKEKVSKLDNKPRIRPFPTQVKQVKVKESLGIKEAFKSFLLDYVVKFDSKIEDLEDLAAKRINWDGK